MKFYTLYFCRSDGSAITFELLEFLDDREAHEKAGAILRDHPTCAYVRLWEGDREVGRIRTEMDAAGVHR